jgi:hypothetical protein
MVGNGSWAELSCHATPDGAVSFTASNKKGERSVTASATEDAHGNITTGNWLVTDDQGTVLSVSLPDGAVGGRTAPTDQEAAESARENAGQLLTRTADACKRGLDLRLF